MLMPALIVFFRQDLSLLTTISHAEIQKLQTVSKSERAERAKFILRDDGPLAWAALKEGLEKKKAGTPNRVDFVLDNGTST